MSERGDLEVEEDRAYQERFWTVQRFAWGVMGLFILAAIAGATGSGGPLAHAVVKTPSGTIDYPRIARWQAADQMTLRFPASTSGPVEVELADTLVQALSVESIEPEPSSSTALGGSRRFTFDLGAGGGEKSIVFNLRPGSPAFPASARARLGSSPPVELDFVVLP